jgi:hypothetical protein
MRPAIMMAWLLMADASYAADCEKAFIFFTPFNLEEVIPRYTNENIRSIAIERFAVSDPDRIARLLEIVQNGPRHTYDYTYATRAAIECGRKLFFIDKYGDVEATEIGDSEHVNRYRIDRKAFLHYHDMLRSDERILER